MKNTLFGCIFAILLFSILYSAFKPRNVRAAPATIIVPDDYVTIQAAVNAASDGDTIFVYSGTYNSSVRINKSVDLIGENMSNTILDPEDFSNTDWEDGMSIRRDNVNISNFQPI